MFDDRPEHDHATFVEFWKTKDGKLHETKADVDRHIVHTLENQVGPLLDEANKTLNPNHHMGPKTKLTVVDTLVGSVDRAIRLKKILDALLD